MLARIRSKLTYAALTCLVAAPLATAATAPPTGAAACTWEGFKITDRVNTSCRVARKALKYYYGGGGSSQGYRCKTTARSGYRAGKCTSGREKSFKFAPRN